MSDATISAELAAYVSSESYQTIPETTRHVARRALLDLVGCGIAGAASSDVKRIQAAVATFSRGDEAAIWGTSSRASITGAALANGAAAHALELDDLGGPGHIGTVVIPAALAMAEHVDCDGKELAAGIVAGYEVLFRLCAGLGGYGAIAVPGWQPIAVLGSFGSAAAAGRIARLDARQQTWAFGLAGSYTGGSYAFLEDGSMAKKWHPGRAASGGLEAVFLAQQGVTGPEWIFEAEWGSFPQMQLPNATLDRETILRGLGVQYLMEGIGFKEYPCCGGVQPYLRGLTELLEEQGIDWSEVVGAEVGVNSFHQKLIGKQVGIETTLDAQMSLAYSLAVFLLFGEVTVESYGKGAIGNDALRSLAERIVLRLVDTPLTAQAVQRIRLTLDDGRIVEGTTRMPRGWPDRPFSDEDLDEKFMRLVSARLGDERAAELASAIWNIGELEHARHLPSLTASSAPGARTGIGV